MRLFEEMIAIWPTAIGAAELRRIADRLGGPGGGWADSTTHDLFERLIEVGSRITWDDVEAKWFEDVLARTHGMVGGKPTASSHFYSASDRPLTHAAAFTLLRCSSSRRETRLREVASVRNIAERFLGRPFAPSRDYGHWLNSLEALAWMKAFVLLVRGGDEAAKLSKEEDAAWEAEAMALDKALAAAPTGRTDGAALFARELAGEPPDP
jgi:hypothetical protein